MTSGRWLARDGLIVTAVTACTPGRPPDNVSSHG